MQSRKKKESDTGDRKKLKVLKQALKDERAAKHALEEENKTMQERIKEQQGENEKLSTKYLALYDENDKLQEMLVSLKYKIESSKAVSELYSSIIAHILMTESLCLEQQCAESGLG